MCLPRLRAVVLAAALLPGLAAAQEIGVTAGSGVLSASTPDRDRFEAATVALSGHLAFPQPIPLAPILAVHYAQFPGVLPDGEATTYLLFGATIGVRVDAFEAGPVVSHLRVGVGAGQQRVTRGVLPLDAFDDVSVGRTSTGGLADVALGATVGARTGPYASVEAVAVSHLRLLSASSHVGARIGGGVRF